MVESGRIPSQSFLCEQTGISQPQMSRYFADGKNANRPSVDALGKICRVLQVDDCAALVVAYLRDLVPDYAQELVQVVAQGGTVPAADPAAMPAMTSEQRAAISFLARLMVEDRDANESLLSLAKFLRGRPEDPETLRVFEEFVSSADRLPGSPTAPPAPPAEAGA
jgi:transcriptional regulator with XRE-family HTH domain